MDFIRRVIVKFLSVTDDSKFEKLTEIDSINGIKINFDCIKNITPSPNVGILQITNLSQSTCDMLITRGLWCEVYAGYNDEGSNLIFAGQISSGTVSKHSSDSILRLMIQTKFDQLDNVYNNEFETDTRVEHIVKDILKKAKIPYLDNDIKIKGDLDWRGISFFSTYRETLNQLSNWYNFTWSIQDAGFVAIDDSEIIKNYAKCESNIISVSSLMDNEEREGTGFTIKCVLNPNFKIGNGIEFNSKFNPKQSIKLYRIAHHISTHDDAWSTILTGYKAGSKKIKNKASI